MKYIKKFEDNIMHIDDSKFKEGDYVISIYNKDIKGIISEVVYYKGDSIFFYSIEGIFGYSYKEGILRLMTLEEIEIYKFEKATNKFNI